MLNETVFCDFQTLWNCRGAFSCTFFIIKTYLLWRPARKRESVTATFDNRQKRNRHDNTSTTLSTIPLFLWPNRGSSFIFRPKAPLCAVMLDNWIRDSLTTVQRNTLKHSWFWPGKLSFIWLAKKDNLMLLNWCWITNFKAFSINFAKNHPVKIRLKEIEKL